MKPQYERTDAERLAAIDLLDQGWTAVQVAEKYGVSRQAVSMWERRLTGRSPHHRTHRNSADRARQRLVARLERGIVCSICGCWVVRAIGAGSQWGPDHHITCSAECAAANATIHMATKFARRAQRQVSALGGCTAIVQQRVLEGLAS